MWFSENCFTAIGSYICYRLFSCYPFDATLFAAHFNCGYPWCIQELGKDDAFSCCELDMVLSETEKVEKWKLHCMDIVGHPVGDVNSLLDALVKV